MSRLVSVSLPGSRGKQRSLAAALLVLCEYKNDSDRISWIKSEHSQHTPSSSRSMSGPENFFKFPSLSKLFWLFQSNMKSYEKLLCACGQNHLRWSCLSISFNFLSEFGFNWTIDHNEDFNRQSKDWARRAGGRGGGLLQLWLRSGLWLLTWVGCGAAKSISTSFCRSGSSVLSIVWMEVWRYSSIEIKLTDRFCNLFTRLWLHAVNIFLYPATQVTRRRKGRRTLVTAKSGASGCDN